MADRIEYSLNGLEGVLGKIEALKADVRFKGGRFALRKAAEVLQRQAVENARRLDDPETAESIAANIAVRWNRRRFEATRDLMFRVGVLGGAREYANNRRNVRKGRAGEAYSTPGDKGNPGGDTWYWRFLEFGTETSVAKPFLRPVASQAGTEAVDEFVTQFNRAMERALRRSATKITHQA